MFEKNLHDLVRGIRTNKNNETKFIAACIEEIRNEIKTVSNLECSLGMRLLNMFSFWTNSKHNALCLFTIMACTKLYNVQFGPRPKKLKVTFLQDKLTIFRTTGPK